MNRAPEVLLEVLSERESQDEKWGPQNHNDSDWHAIFGEEVGEVAKEVVEGRFSGRTTDNLRAELVQAAAVAVAWIEALDRRNP